MEYVTIHRRKGASYYAGHKISQQIQKPYEYYEVLSKIDKVIGSLK